MSTREALLTTRFNEAEAHTPRMRIQDVQARSRPTRFNEAEAHAPRMPTPKSCSPLRRAGFNEAEAHTPRMLPRYNPLVVKAILADFRAICAATGKISRI